MSVKAVKYIIKVKRLRNHLTIEFQFTNKLALISVDKFSRIQTTVKGFDKDFKGHKGLVSMFGFEE